MSFGGAPSAGCTWLRPSVTQWLRIWRPADRGHGQSVIGTVESMKPLAALPAAELQSVRAVLADIDDTISADGRVTGAAYCALERLQQAGFIVVPVTGRPAGWCDLIARTWPVDAVVGENGAFYMRYDRARRKLMTRLQDGV